VPTTLLMMPREPKTTKAATTTKKPGSGTTTGQTPSQPKGKAGDKKADLKALSMKMSGGKHSPPSGRCNKRPGGKPATPKAKSKVTQRSPNWKLVKDGTTVTGEAADGLWTYSLKTCAGAVAFDTVSKKKVQAHITALTGDADYEAQWATFKAAVLSHTSAGSRQITLSLGPLDYAPANLHPAMTQMNNWLKAEALKLQSSAKTFTRGHVAEGGEQSISADGEILNENGETC